MQGWKDPRAQRERKRERDRLPRATQDGKAGSELWIPDSVHCFHSAVAELNLSSFVLGPFLLLLGNKEVGEGAPLIPRTFWDGRKGSRGEYAWAQPLWPRGWGGFLLAETSGQARAWGGGLGTVFSCGVVRSFVFQDGFCMGKELGAGP